MSWRSDRTPDYDDTDEYLQSFPSIRAKTLATLYGDQHDKSPKGSVDEPILSLVNLINSHPSFATLSSCSGRIALFDPTGGGVAVEHEMTNDDGDMATSIDLGGKGTGKWVIASHEKLSEQLALEAIENIQDTNTLLSFRFEPMLLHVAAANLKRAQQLLQIALQLGFRESGLIVTDSRATVAIRSYSLSLTVPFQASGPWQVPVAYWKEMVRECNERLATNLRRLCDLEKNIKASLFQAPTLPALQSSLSLLPDLNLWGHASIALRYEEDETAHVLVFGGYGSGPDSTNSKGAARSSKVYRLTYSLANNIWDDGWQQVPIKQDASSSYRFGDIQMTPYQWTAREGVACCDVSSLGGFGGSGSSVLLFGGRLGPAVPLNDFVLFDYSNYEGSFASCAKSVTGMPPSARWGHTLNRIAHHMAFLVGGRNTTDAVSDPFYVLRFLIDNKQLRGFQWERVADYDQSLTRFHHAACTTGNHFFVFGGLREPLNLLEPFYDNTNDSIFVCTLSDKPSRCDIQISTDFDCGFGAQATLLQHLQDGESNIVELFLTGGVSCNTEEGIELFNFHLLKTLHNEGDVKINTGQSSVVTSTIGNLGPLVNHKVLRIADLHDSKHNLLVSVGGGTAGFAFQPLFAKCFLIHSTSCTSPDSTSLGQTTIRVVSKADAHVNTKSDTTHLATSTDTTTVAFVRKEHAKKVKTDLEKLGYLSQTHRMGPALESPNLTDHCPYIAVPITEQAVSILENEDPRAHSSSEAWWVSFVEGIGQQSLPLRSAVFAGRNKRK